MLNGKCVIDNMNIDYSVYVARNKMNNICIKGDLWVECKKVYGDIVLYNIESSTHQDRIEHIEKLNNMSEKEFRNFIEYSLDKDEDLKIMNLNEKLKQGVNLY